MDFQIFERIEAQKAQLLHFRPRLGSWFVPVSGFPGGRSLPFLSIRAFKYETVFQADQKESPALVFSSSGSTFGRVGRHPFSLETLTDYSQSARRDFHDFLDRIHLRGRAPVISLLPPHAKWPSSSLAYMVSSFQSSRTPVHFSSPDQLNETLRALWKAGWSEVIIFGTSLHHCLVGQGEEDMSVPHFSRLAVIDTGGNKGKTACLEPHELSEHLLSLYSRYGPVEVFSEYGMCELSSQAYSVKSGALRRFSCSAHLRVCAVDPVTFQRIAPGHTGLLAFYDASNTSSCSAILTEDMGHVHQEETGGFSEEFTLLGRAPLANLKGCSLRVNGALPLSWSQPGRTTNEWNDSALDSIEETFHPPSECHTPAEQRALKKAWESYLQARKDLCLEKCQTPHELEIVASANVPITFLFPLLAANELGYTRCHLKIPNNRDDDPLSVVCRRQILWLLSWLKPRLQCTLTWSSTWQPRPADGKQHRTLVIFGTDETVSILSEEARAAWKGQAKGLRIFGFGNLRNAQHLSLLTEEAWVKAARKSMLWNGRGCLTPWVISTDFSPQESRHALSAFQNEFAVRVEEAFKRVPENVRAAYHRHDLLELRAWLSLPDVDPQTCIWTPQNPRRSPAVTVDLRPLRGRVNLDTLNVDLAGQGLIFFAYREQLQTLDLQITWENSEPGFLDCHQGRPWLEWLAPECHNISSPK